MAQEKNDDQKPPRAYAQDILGLPVDRHEAEILKAPEHLRGIIRAHLDNHFARLAGTIHAYAGDIMSVGGRNKDEAREARRKRLALVPDFLRQQVEAEVKARFEAKRRE